MVLAIGGQNPSLEILKLGYLPDGPAPELYSSRRSTNFDKEIKKRVPRLRKVSLEVEGENYSITTMVNV